MFQYEFEKRPPSAGSCSSRATMTTDWSRVYPSARSYPARVSSVCPSVERARRPLPPRPIDLSTMPTKTTVPLKVWIIASASCFAVCAALVLATVVITKWGTTESYTTRELFPGAPEPIYSRPYPHPKTHKTTKDPLTTTEAEITTTFDELEDDIEMPILEKLSVFKNVVANREKNKRIGNKKTDISLATKPQLHPIHDTSLHHEERRIEKKDQAKYPLHLDITRQNKKIATSDVKNLATKEINKQIHATNEMDIQALNNEIIKHENVPDFKPTLPDVIKVVDGYVTGLRKHEVDYEEYYNDENLYDDYMESNTMTSYLIEKVQELHEWMNSDPDFQAANITKPKTKNGNDFTHLLKALNDSLVEGNVTIIMTKLKDIYFGDNYTMANHSRKVILSNSTDLLSFGILTLDIMLLHNIQLMAWENQEPARNKMLKDPDVFAFNALFLDPGKIESKQIEVLNHNDNSASLPTKRQNLRHDLEDYYDFGKNLLENILEVGMSTARAAIHLGRAYKSTKVILTQLSNRESINANIQQQISRNSDANTHALHHLQTSFNGSSVANVTEYTELDCVWLLYCRNLVSTAKLNAPYGTMARINGMALRMLTGELSADKALDTMLYEVLTGWTELRCNDMFPRCSKVNAASVVMDSILQPLRKSQSTNRSR